MLTIYLLIPWPVHPDLCHCTPSSRGNKSRTQTILLPINIKDSGMVENGDISFGQSEIRKSFQEEAAFEPGRMGNLWMDGDGKRREGRISSISNKGRGVVISGLCTETLERLGMNRAQGDGGEQGKGGWQLTFADLSSLQTPSACLASCEGHSCRSSINSHGNPVNPGLHRRSLQMSTLRLRLGHLPKATHLVEVGIHCKSASILRDTGLGSHRRF